jgi:hypothetical protein
MAATTAADEELIGGLSVAEIRARIFALPLPPIPEGRRSYPVDTVLGRLMRLRRLTIHDVTRLEGAPSARWVGEILAGRAQLGQYRVPLAVGLGVDPRIL